ncbi:MAG: MBL fold metallo-hydrolase, partial [Evtepia sp.]
ATTVHVPIGKPYIIVGDKEVPNDTAALIQNDRTYLPIRAVLEAFDAYVSWDATQNSVAVDTTSPLLRVRFLDVGQGDTILIDMGATEILIDGGDNKAGKTVVKDIKPYIDDQLDYIIATHPDADHIGGLDNVLEAFSVGEVIDSGKKTDSATYRAYQNAAKSEVGCTLSLDENRVIPIGTDASLRIIETGDNLSTANDNSVIALLTYKNTTVLLTGDMSQTIERAQLSLFSDVDVLKVGHHGSATSSCQEFLSVVKPEYAVISYKPGNTYHHPTSATLHRLLERGTIAYGTGKSGTIVLSTNGTAYSFNKSNPLLYEDAGDAA